MEFDWEGRGDLLFRMVQAITERQDPEASYHAILSVTAEAIRADSGSLALALPETGEIQVVAALNPSPGQVGRVLPAGEGVLGWVVSQGQPLLLQGDASSDSRFAGLNPDRRRPGSAICWPIRSGDRIIGALSLNREGADDAFSDEEFRQGEQLLSIAAVGVDNLQAQATQARQMAQLQVMVEAQRELQRVDRDGLAGDEAEATLYRRMAEYVAKVVSAHYAAVGLFHSDGSLRAFHTTGMDQATIDALGHIPEGKGLLGDLFRDPTPERINDVHADPRFGGFPAGHPDMRTLVAQPLQRGRRTFGVLYAAERTDGRPFTAEDSAYLSMFAAQAVDLLERLELMGSLEERADDLHRQLLTAVKVFANLLELRSPTLAGHANRVAENAVAVGQRLGLDQDYLEDLHIAGLLHDVGMLAMPDTLLRKPYSLLHSGDRKRMREHPILGEANLMALESLDRAARLIRHHHEYLDGSGYPDGLKGEAIPIGARILAVANEFDDLVEGTLFVRRISPDKALEYLAERVDKRYDRDAVVALAEELGLTHALSGEAAEGEAETGKAAAQPAKAAGKAAGGGNRAANTGRRRRRKEGAQGAQPAAPANGGGETESQAGPLRVLESARLQAGMTLARDLVTEEGMLLLSKGYELDEALIAKIRYFERRLGRRFQVAVVDDRQRPGQEG